MRDFVGVCDGLALSLIKNGKKKKKLVTSSSANFLSRVSFLSAAAFPLLEILLFV
jgi:hypothetical protein